MCIIIGNVNQFIGRCLIPLDLWYIRKYSWSICGFLGTDPFVAQPLFIGKTLLSETVGEIIITRFLPRFESTNSPFLVNWILMVSSITK